MRSERLSQSALYCHTLSRHSRLNSATEIVAPAWSPMSVLPLMPSRFSTSISTGRPCVSHPAMRVTRRPCIAW